MQNAKNTEKTVIFLENFFGNFLWSQRLFWKFLKNSEKSQKFRKFRPIFLSFFKNLKILGENKGTQFFGFLKTVFFWGFFWNFWKFSKNSFFIRKFFKNFLKKIGSFLNFRNIKKISKKLIKILSWFKGTHQKNPKKWSFFQKFRDFLKNRKNPSVLVQKNFFGIFGYFYCKKNAQNSKCLTIDQFFKM